MTAIQRDLFAMQDMPYREFQVKLIPDVPPETVIGVRTPALRQYAKTLVRSGDAAAFLDTLPHTYFDENQLHAFLLSGEKDYAQVLSRRLNACRSELEQDYALSFRQAKLHGVRSLVITPLTEEGDARGRKGTQGDAFERAAGS